MKLTKSLQKKLFEKVIRYTILSFIGIPNTSFASDLEDFSDILEEILNSLKGN